ncbi:hypothetical protein L484_005737 [Morus notabilis]|uniref:Membrane-associated kinase regulator 4 n=1 Tax=Morus notabilis TaxID=981085 RepID=W9QL43_9ROSA|nr:hypothetical protein L484_005737 [Morus notabilis]
MATTTQASHQIDDEYIDMEISSSSSSNFFPYSSISSPPNSANTTKEFEFQMSSVPNQDKETSTFPADELFYKGKLLPLHLPPRLQMVQNILQNSNKTSTNSNQDQEEEEEDLDEEEEEETFTIPFNMHRSSFTAPCTNTTNTPLESSNISPSESCRVSCELNPDEVFSQWSTEVRVFIGGQSKKSWSTKLMKPFSIGRKLKASRAYLKSLFNKSSCNVSDNKNNILKPTCNDQFNTNADSKRNPFGKMRENAGKYHQIISTTLVKSIENEIMINSSQHRKSFSGVIQRHISSGANSKSSLLSTSTSTSSSASSSSSSSFSLSSNGGCCDHFNLLKRSSSASSELESSIEGAIAHCKLSSQQFHSARKSTNFQDGVFNSLSNVSDASRIAV